MPEPQASAAPAPETGSIFDPVFRERTSPAGFRAFLGVADKLRLSVQDRCRLLGGLRPSTYHSWKSAGAPTLAVDQLERISLVLGIFKGLRLLFADDATGLRWLEAGNSDYPFAGDSPLATMLRGSITDLHKVRRYIDAWRGVWP